MDEALLAMLESKGITEATINVLVEEDVVTKSTFALLQEEHLQKLLPKITIGQHALITSLWLETATESEGIDQRTIQLLCTVLTFVTYTIVATPDAITPPSSEQRGAATYVSGQYIINCLQYIHSILHVQ